MKVSDLAKKARARSGGGNKEAEKTPESQLIEGADQYEGRYSFRKERESVRGLPRWWESKDRDVDGQVSMGEYLAKSEARDRLSDLNEFERFDLNGDGIITPAEAEAVDE